MSAPLTGIRVLELARILAGPWCGQVLADLGADVVKVERSGAGDDTRQWGPPFVMGETGEDLGAAYFHSCNRGKRCIAADFETREGQALVTRLASHADVVIENFKVGGLKRYGLDPESLRALNPRLVVCSISGFGQDGPYAARAGYDFLIQGMGGAMSLTGAPDGPPTKAGMAIADIFTGLYAANGIQACPDPPRRDRGGGLDRLRPARRPGVGAGLSGAQFPGLGAGGAPARQRPPQHRALRRLPGGGWAHHHRGGQRWAVPQIGRDPGPTGSRRCARLGPR